MASLKEAEALNANVRLLRKYQTDKHSSLFRYGSKQLYSTGPSIGEPVELLLHPRSCHIKLLLLYFALLNYGIEYWAKLVSEKGSNTIPVVLPRML